MRDLIVIGRALARLQDAAAILAANAAAGRMSARDIEAVALDLRCALYDARWLAAEAIADGRVADPAAIRSLSGALDLDIDEDSDDVRARAARIMRRYV